VSQDMQKERIAVPLYHRAHDTDCGQVFFPAATRAVMSENSFSPRALMHRAFFTESMEYRERITRRNIVTHGDFPSRGFLVYRSSFDAGSAHCISLSCYILVLQPPGVSKERCNNARHFNPSPWRNIYDKKKKAFRIFCEPHENPRRGDIKFCRIANGVIEATRSRSD